MLRERLNQLVANRDDDLGPQLVSWSISLALAAVWLAVVQLSSQPAVPIPPSVSPAPDIVDFEPGRFTPPESRVGKARDTKRSIVGPRIAGADVAEAFAATIVRKVSTDVAALIERVEAVGAITTTVLGGEKATLATGGGRATPGVAKFGNDANARGQLGTVTHGAEVQRAEVRLKPLAIVATPLPEASIDATEAAAFVRARAAQLQYCYVRSAGVESDLAGVVTLRLVLGPNGTVRNADVVRRTWSGPGAAETEECLLTAARKWRVPSAADGATLTLPISFTRSR